MTNCHSLKMQAADGKMRLTKAARVQLENTTGKKVVIRLNAKHLDDSKLKSEKDEE